MDLLKVIKDCFEGDDDVYKYYDPNESISNIHELSISIYRKIKEHFLLFDCEFVDLGYGYIFYVKTPKLLVSFCVKKKERNKEILKKFWGDINNILGSDFKCFLWWKNKRAINYLIKNGMKIETVKLLDNHKIIILCH